MAAASSRPALVLLLAVVFLTDATTVMAVPGYGSSYLLQTLRAPAAFPGLALSVYGLTKVGAAPGGGRLLDHVSAPAVALGAGVLQVAGLAVLFAARSATAFLGGVGLLSLGAALTWLVCFLVVGRGVGQTAHVSAAALTAVSALAVGAGLAMSVLCDLLDLGRAPFLAASVPAATGALVLGVIAAKVHSRAQPKLERASGGTFGGVVFGHFLLLGLAAAVCIPLALDELGLSLTRTAVLLAPAGAAGAAGIVLAGRPGAGGPRTASPGGLLYVCAAASLGVLAVFRESELALAILAIPLVSSFAAATTLATGGILANSAAARHQGKALGSLFLAEGAGAVVGPAAGATAVAVGGVTTGLGLATACAIALALFLRATRGGTA